MFRGDFHFSNSPVGRYVLRPFLRRYPHTRWIRNITVGKFLTKLCRRRRIANELSRRKFFNFCHVRLKAHEQYFNLTFQDVPDEAHCKLVSRPKRIVLEGQ